MALKLRKLSPEEYETIEKLAHSRTAAARLVEHARIMLLANQGLIEPWWKVPRLLALKGRCCDTRDQVCQAIAAATAYWNAQRHPFVWGPSSPSSVAASSKHRGPAKSSIDLLDAPLKMI